jgi:hypothetical protein
VNDLATIVVPADALFWTAMVFTVAGSLVTRWVERRDRGLRQRRRRALAKTRRLDDRRFAELTATYLREQRAEVQARLRARLGRDVRVVSPAGLLIQTESFPNTGNRS